MRRMRRARSATEVIVGGGLGRTPMIGKVLRDFLPEEDLLPYLEAMVSVWNLLGRRDNKYKARIKITVHEHGIDDDPRAGRSGCLQDPIRPEHLVGYRPGKLFAEIKGGLRSTRLIATPCRWRSMRPPINMTRSSAPGSIPIWPSTSAPGYAIVQISLKAHGATPGDATSGTDAGDGGSGREIWPRSEVAHQP